MTHSATAPTAAQALHGHCFTAERRWSARMELDFAVRQGRTTLAKMQFHGPLRVQRPFYPEPAPAKAAGRAQASQPCHCCLLHPPGGLVSGDDLSLDVRLGQGAHALLTAAWAVMRCRPPCLPWGAEALPASRPRTKQSRPNAILPRWKAAALPFKTCLRLLKILTMRQPDPIRRQPILPSMPRPFPFLPSSGNGPEQPCAAACFLCAILGQTWKKPAIC